MRWPLGAMLHGPGMWVQLLQSRQGQAVRTLTDNLKRSMSDPDFDAALANVVNKIY